MSIPDDLSRSLESVLRKFRAMVLSVGARHALRGDDLDELEQDVRIRLWHGRTTSEEIRALPTSYIYQTAMSAALDMLRRRRRVDARSAPLDDSRVPNIAHRAQTDERAQLHELEHQVEAALTHLVPNRRVVVRMSLAGYDRQQIAVRLGWSDAKVRNLLSRGMDDLRAQLAERLTEETTDG